MTEHSFAMSLGRRPFEAEAKGLPDGVSLCFDALIACVEIAGPIGDAAAGRRASRDGLVMRSLAR